VVEFLTSSATDTLEYFHELLDGHFRGLHDRRSQLDPPGPVFALEHALKEDELAVLQDAARSAHRTDSLSRTSGRLWLPFAVHAAEVGYIYDGVEYWPIYARETPSWSDSEHERDRVRGWLEKFSKQYGGAIPRGAWANTFKKIAWPITHAVLPRYLQVQLAKLLSDHRHAWPSLLDDPVELGARLHLWSWDYTDRLEKFCQNTALVGHVAVALVSGEDDESPYLEPSTLKRLVASLNSERQSRRWLQDARRSARSVRTRHFQHGGGDRHAGGRSRLGTDPKLQLRCDAGVWKAYAVLPDLRPLQHTLPTVYDALRTSRAEIAGGRRVIPTGGLLYATPAVELASWPSSAAPFLLLQGASPEVNTLIADECRITPGPWWVFRQKSGEPAVEVRGKFVRPGSHYTVLGSAGTKPPDVAWCERVEQAFAGASAYELCVPAVLVSRDAQALTACGLSVVSDVSVSPVGVVASAWDGEGSVEWLAGEAALIVIRAEHAPAHVALSIDGEPSFYADWPTGGTELLLALEGLEVGEHQIVVSLRDGDDAGSETVGTLIATIRDGQVVAQGGSAGEGIRARLVPAQPSLPELWNGQAVVEADGPESASAELSIALRDSDGRELGSCRRSLELPLSADGWRRLFEQVRGLPDLERHYDAADSAEIGISRSGVGFATLTCERGFRGLRWVIAARHEGGYTARLIDRTDGSAVSVQLFRVEAPLRPEPHLAGEEFIGPVRGGLLWATNGEQVAAQIIPPDPNELMRVGIAQPLVPIGKKSLDEVQKLMLYWRMWRDADLPAHPFGIRERQRVLDALRTAVAAMLAPGKWAEFEHRIAGIAAADVDLGRACALVGEAPAHRIAAAAIAKDLSQWKTPEGLIRGFRTAVSPLLASAGVPNEMAGARFLLQLASAPGELLDWEGERRAEYLRCVFTDPVLIRAARFAVLGTVEEVAGGAG